MRYQILAIGSLKKSFCREGCRFYQDRLKAYSKIEMIELKESKASSPQLIQQQDGESLLQAADGLLVGLDESGRTFRSKQFADWITELENQGISKLSLMVGGAEGHSDQLKRESKVLWSLSPLTFPHDLARLLLFEQLYRAETIRAGHPYHRGMTGSRG
jgi:23S rRNA (pseudouridine1915-N3)-methyltransferase